MKRTVRTLFVLTGLAAFAASALSAQQPSASTDVVDRIVAVVGDSIVLQSDLTEELYRLAASGQSLPEDPAELEQLRQQVLDSRIDQLLLLQAAAADSLQVPEQEVSAQVQRFVAQQRQTFGGEQQFRQALEQQGLTLAQYRDMLAQESRHSLLVQQYMSQMQRTQEPPTVTEDEIREFFGQQREQLGDRPATISFQQVVIDPSPSDSARTAARSRAEEVLTELRNGGDFAVLARQYSDDPGTREQGGDLGWFRPSEMVAPFADAVQSLRPGQTSGIVETPFGFHVIRMDRVRGGEYKARHILLQASLEQGDRQRAQDVAIEVAEKARAGTPMDTLIERYGDPAEQSSIGPYPREELPEPYGSEMNNVEAGTVTGPFTLSGQSGQEKWAVVKVTEVTEAGEYTLDDVRSQIRQQIQQRKMMDELVSDLRERTYVDIRL